jgi:serine protease AprX
MRDGKVSRNDIDEAVKASRPLSVLLPFEIVTGKARLARDPLHSAVALYPAELAQIEYESPTTTLWRDAPCKLSLDHARHAANGPTAAEVYPSITGEGVRVAILDTGIDLTHPDFAGRIEIYKKIAAATTFADTNGHGTHVASIAAGSGIASDRRYRGFAPDSTLLIYKVSADNGSIQESDLMAAVWEALTDGADIINISAGSDTLYDPEHPFSLLAEYVVGQGICIVAAAGNDGPIAGSVDFPASIPEVIAVGSVDSAFEINNNSSRGPNAAGQVKPDLVAVGVDVCAARSTSSPFTAAPSFAYYTVLSGTSVSSPAVAGAIACLKQAHPDASVDELRQQLTAYCYDLGLSANTQGVGALDLFRSLYSVSERDAMTQLSTGLKSALLGTSGLTEMMNYGVIEVYSGESPQFAHFAPTGTLLAVITDSGNPFTQGSPTNGLQLNRDVPGELRAEGEWRMKGVATGTAGWWRWKWYLADPNTTDPYYPRIDGVVGDSLFLDDLDITPSTDVAITNFVLTVSGEA